MFCYPEHIDREMRQLFSELERANFLRGFSKAEFAAHAARLLVGLNAIHPFREGNGRAQLAYLTLLAASAGHPLNLERLDSEAMLAAMISGFLGDEAQLVALLAEMIES
jgi:cell filamentation protein